MRYKITITWSNGDITSVAVVAEHHELAIALAVFGQLYMHNVSMDKGTPTAVEWELVS